MAPFLRNKQAATQQGQEIDRPDYIDDQEDEDESPQEEEDKRPVINELAPPPSHPPQAGYDMGRHYEPDDDEDSDDQDPDLSRLQVQRRKVLTQKKYSSHKMRTKGAGTERLLTP